MHISPWMTDTATFLIQLLILFAVAGFLVILRKKIIFFGRRFELNHSIFGRRFCCTSFMKLVKRACRDHLFRKS